ncbi:MAG: ABC transporter substrate-binding protein [Oscillospiraceae bacterium]|nr:ABC transporter substrate-binding protein [Oscillospiraceae bacterium]
MKRTAVLIALAIAVLASACAGSGARQNPETFEVTDRYGQPLTVPADIGRIVCIAPAAADILVDLGLGEKIIAVDYYSSLKSGIPESLPVFDLMSPDAEQIAALEPDAVISSGMSAAGGEHPLSPLAAMGICLIDIPMANSIDDIRSDIRFLGEVTKTSEAADAIIAGMDAQIEEIQAAVSYSSYLPSVYFEVTSYGPYSCGSDTFIDEMLKIAGCQNIFSHIEGWLLVSEEAVLAADPDIIFTSADDGFDPVESITGRAGWDAVEAVRDGRVFAVDPDACSQPNHKVVTALRQMAEARGVSVSDSAQ